MAYEFDGKKYEKASTYQKEWGDRIVGKFELKGTEQILDQGCGDGVLPARLSWLAPKGRTPT